MKSRICKTMLIVIAAISLTAVQLYAQAPDTLWTKTFGGGAADDGYSVRPTPDGGYIIGAETWSFGAGSGDLWLIKTDAEGNQEWNNTYGDCGYQEICPSEAILTSDGGYAASGSTYSFGGGCYWLVKTNASGVKLWEKTYRLANYSYSNSVSQTTDGGYILTGSTCPWYGSTYLWLVKTDTAGNMLWDRAFGGSYSLGGLGVQQTADGGYITAGLTCPSGAYEVFDVLLIKTDADGQPGWSQTYVNPGYDVANDVQQTTDGGYILAGGTCSAYNTRGLLMKVDASGNQEWNQVFGITSIHAAFRSVRQTSDGGFIMSGSIDMAGYAGTDLWIVKTNASGAEEWSCVLGGPQDETGFDVQETSDGGYIAVGSTASYGMGSDDVWLVRLAPAELPPVADAGPDQTIHAGETVCLDGGASYDDNTTTDSLLYNWTFISKPEASTATLTDANTQTPWFVADLPGTYVVRLVVTDDAGLSSEPDDVMISSENLAPTADAGADDGRYVGELAQLNGTGSFDPDADPLTFAWSITAVPDGSNAVLYDETTATPYFYPDLPGMYIVQLIVNDGFAASAPDEVVISVITAANFAENNIMEALNYINALPLENFTTKGNKTALGNFLTQAIAALQAGDIETAVNKLNMALDRTDGCVLRGEPDGNGPGRDWIIDCLAQEQVYQLLTDALNAISL